MFDSRRIGEMVRFHRKMARLSQVELAKLSGVGKTVVFDLEHGKETVRLSTLMKILIALNITIGFHGPLIQLFEKEHHETS
jgi:y4mF family transcriptional regulator